MGRHMSGNEWIGRVRWQCRVLAEKTDYLDILAITLIAVIAGLGLTVIIPLKNMENRLNTQIVEAARQAATLARPDEPLSLPVQNSPGTLSDFLTFLPEASQRPFLLRKLHDLGSAQGVKTGKVEYSPIALTNLPVDGLLIRLEWQGDDTALRTALHQLLQDFPSIAIRSLTFGRNPDTGLGNLALELALYYRREESHAP